MRKNTDFSVVGLLVIGVLVIVFAYSLGMVAFLAWSLEAPFNWGRLVLYAFASSLGVLLLNFIVGITKR